MDNIPCLHARHFTDQVPVPFGSGNCSMPGFECEYGGSIEIPDEMVCNENKDCPAYESVLVQVCPVYNREYVDWCDKCMDKEMSDQA